MDIEFNLLRVDLSQTFFKLLKILVEILNFLFRVMNMHAQFFIYIYSINRGFIQSDLQLRNTISDTL